jgi:hypothetical protein
LWLTQLWECPAKSSAKKRANTCSGWAIVKPQLEVKSIDTLLIQKCKFKYRWAFTIRTCVAKLSHALSGLSESTSYLCTGRMQPHRTTAQASKAKTSDIDAARARSALECPSPMALQKDSPGDSISLFRQSQCRANCWAANK